MTKLIDVLLALSLCCLVSAQQTGFNVTVNFDDKRNFMMSAWLDISIISMDQMIVIAHFDGEKDPFATGKSMFTQVATGFHTNEVGWLSLRLYHKTVGDETIGIKEVIVADTYGGHSYQICNTMNGTSFWLSTAGGILGCHYG